MSKRTEIYGMYSETKEDYRKLLNFLIKEIIFEEKSTSWGQIKIEQEEDIPVIRDQFEKSVHIFKETYRHFCGDNSCYQFETIQSDETVMFVVRRVPLG